MAVARVFAASQPLSGVNVEVVADLLAAVLPLGAAPSEADGERLLGELGPRVDEALDGLGALGEDVADQFLLLLTLLRPRPFAELVHPPPSPSRPPPAILRVAKRPCMLERLGPLAAQAQVDVGGRGGSSAPDIQSLPPVPAPPAPPAAAAEPAPPPPASLPPPVQPASAGP